MIYKARCSSLKELMTGRAKKDGSIDFGDTVKSMVKRQVVNELFGYGSPKENQYTKKGLLLEDDAIKAVGLLTGTLPVITHGYRVSVMCLPMKLYEISSVVGRVILTHGL